MGELMGELEAQSGGSAGSAGQAVAAIWCSSALIDGVAVASVRLHPVDGRIARIERGVAGGPADLRLGVVLPGAANAHSHLFHRLLRGRTHGDGGDFWSWRDRMYAEAEALNPASYEIVAREVFGEMLANGYTAVGEFHYLHHRPDGMPWPGEHAMEEAVVRAASVVGIRLTLLDTCYLAAGIRRPVRGAQRGFSDGTVERWLERWHALRQALADTAGPDAAAGPGTGTVTLGAALHSVRAVPRPEIAAALAGLPADVPLHVHLSEQPQENAECEQAYGRTPTGLLAELGALTPRLSVVHATHLTDADVRLLGQAGVTVVLCPSTEADLGDGIGPALALARAGARLAIGSDQNAVVDPFLELRGVEYGQRLLSGRRGRFTPAELGTLISADGYRSLGHRGGIAVGAWCDLVEVDAQSVRTRGSLPEQIGFAATAADVRRVLVGGVVRSP